MKNNAQPVQLPNPALAAVFAVFGGPTHLELLNACIKSTEEGETQEEFESRLLHTWVED